jgi:HSP20 family protein
MANLIGRDSRAVARNGQYFTWAPSGAWEPLRVFDALLGLENNRAARTNAVWSPRFDVKENKDGYAFTADLPGVKDSDLDISVTGNVLTIAGKREDERRQDGDQFYRTERSYGQFTRSFVLPEGADTSSITANLKDGVLNVTLAKTPEVQPRKIPVGKGTSETPAKAA